jgi:hypothetical protein
VAFQATLQDGSQRIYLFTPGLRFRGPNEGSWDNPANWTLGIKPASVHDVYIDPQGNLDVNGPAGEATVRSLTLGATGNGIATLRIPAGGTLRASALTILPKGKLIVEGGATIHADFFDNQSTVNVNDVLVMDYDGGSPLSSIRAQIIKGYHNGTWTGDGITSAAAAANPSARAIGYAEAHDVLPPGTTTFAGATVDDSSILVRLTIPGDANLDGAVGFADLVSVAQHYGIADGHAVWSAGDFNYDGNIGFGDLVAVAQHYGGALAAEVPGASAQFEADWAAAVASVPEPGSLYVFLGIAAAMAWRRGASRRAPAQPGQ